MLTLTARKWASVGAALALMGCASRAADEAIPSATAVQISGDRIGTSRGDLIIHPVNHATVVLSGRGHTIHVDPVGSPERYAALPRPSLILVTDIHADHLNPDTLTALADSGTVIVAPQAVREQLPSSLQSITRVLANGASLAIGGATIEAVPMYNLTPDRLQFHPKGRGNGYVVSIGEKRIYIAGDTEDIPEMRALQNIDIAFVPMNLPYTMTVVQAADAVRAFRPRVVYPYHSRGSDVAEFARLVGTDANVEVRIRDWY